MTCLTSTTICRKAAIKKETAAKSIPQPMRCSGLKQTTIFCFGSSVNKKILRTIKFNTVVVRFDVFKYYVRRSFTPCPSSVSKTVFSYIFYKKMVDSDKMWYTVSRMNLPQSDENVSHAPHLNSISTLPYKHNICVLCP